jgi:hypothetical protein
VKPITHDGVTYIPVHQVNPTENINRTVIQPKTPGPLDTFKVDGKTYIPINTIPKEYRPTFKNAKPVEEKPLVVIKVNDKNFVPVSGTNVKKIDVGGVTYIPVKAAPLNATDTAIPVKST